MDVNGDFVLGEDGGGGVEAGNDDVFGACSHAVAEDGQAAGLFAGHLGGADGSEPELLPPSLMSRMPATDCPRVRAMTSRMASPMGVLEPVAWRSSIHWRIGWRFCVGWVASPGSALTNTADGPSSARTLDVRRETEGPQVIILGQLAQQIEPGILHRRLEQFHARDFAQAGGVGGEALAQPLGGVENPLGNGHALEIVALVAFFGQAHAAGRVDQDACNIPG